MRRQDFVERVNAKQQIVKDSAVTRISVTRDPDLSSGAHLNEKHGGASSLAHCFYSPTFQPCSPTKGTKRHW